MDMIEVTKINMKYRLKMIDENYENDIVNDIYMVSSEAITWHERIGTDADTYTGGEATRRFERAMRELETLLGN